MLVAVLGSLLALAVLVYGVVKPLQAARAEALAEIRTYETFTARVRAAGGTLATPSITPRRQGDPVRVVSEAASAKGLTVQPQAVAGGVRVTIANAQYETIMAWLADLAGSSDLRVRSLSIQRTAQPGRVSATVDLGA